MRSSIDVSDDGLGVGTVVRADDGKRREGEMGPEEGLKVGFLGWQMAKGRRKVEIHRIDEDVRIWGRKKRKRKKKGDGCGVRKDNQNKTTKPQLSPIRRTDTFTHPRNTD